MTVRAKATAADFEALLALPENAEKRLELLDGEIIEMSPASELPTVIAAEIVAYLRAFARQHSLGIVTGPDGGFQLSPTDVLAPDAAFIAAGRLKGLRQRGFFQLAPDLAVEVISPSDSVTAAQRKAARYLAFGVREVWLIYPSERRADICRSDPSGESNMRVKQLEPSDALESALLPNFRLPLAELFNIGLPILDESETTETSSAQSSGETQ
ncbi:MAG: Uma2 family endonuclease [Anaerolineae bacterium]|nr:Uma2 family endonuclease [Anaerolineae bacterium]